MIFSKCFKELKTFTALLSELLCLSELLRLSCRRKENFKSAIHLWFIPLVIFALSVHQRTSAILHNLYHISVHSQAKSETE